VTRYGLGMVALGVAVGVARAEGPVYTAGRVLITADGSEQGWIDYLVDGEGEAALERCQRLLRDSLRENVAGPHIARHVVRECEAAPLPTRSAEQEARIFRKYAPLPVVDLFAIGLPGTRGRIVSSLITPSEAACAEMREVEMRDAPPGESRPRRWLDEDARRTADQVCADAKRMEQSAGGGGMWKKIPRQKRVRLKLARERCAHALDRDKFEGKHAGVAIDAPSCVRE
jgi:hypothetical protein